jgi:capsular exopolysaccharide synthesis family protein
MVATGVPVIGLIPRIPHASGRVALITGRRRLKGSPAMLAGPPTPAVGNGRHSGPRTYTFLATEPVPAEVTPVSKSEPPRARPVPAAGLELTVTQWTNMLAEAYSLLLTNITFARTSPPTKVVVVTSPLAEDGKSTCAVNLAITLALRGGKVLLVDADLRRGVVHATLGVERAPGLSEVLAGSRPPEATIRTMKVGDHGGLLHFLPTGAVPPNPSALLESAAYQALLDRWKDEYETIIVDSPPVNVISDASILGLKADTVLLVARSGVTESSALRFAVEQLTRVGVPLLGVVLNDIDFKREAMYDASYRGYDASQYLTAVGRS